MSALDLDALEARCKDTIAEWTLVYAQSGETLPDDAVETKAARETLALITRLRAAEARTAWQPIETAPKMEWVLARRENLHIPPVVVRRRDRKSPVTLLMDAAFYDDNGSRIRGLTHWSPIPTDATLPDAPEAP